MRLAEPLDGLLCFGVNLGGQNDLNFGEQISWLSVFWSDAAAFGAELGAARGQRRNAERDRAFGSWHIDLSAQHGFAERDRNFYIEPRATSLKVRMGQHMHSEQDVARRSPARRFFPLASK